MTSEELDTFLTLKFYPPVATEDYADSIPESVQEILVKGSPSGHFETTRKGFIFLISAYCGPALFTKEFWGALKDELTRYYTTNPADSC